MRFWLTLGNTFSKLNRVLKEYASNVCFPHSQYTIVLGHNQYGCAPEDMHYCVIWTWYLHVSLCMEYRGTHFLETRLVISRKSWIHVPLLLIVVVGSWIFDERTFTQQSPVSKDGLHFCFTQLLRLDVFQLDTVVVFNFI